jgi:hypothetical protein
MGYKQRPSDTGTPGVAIVQLSNGTPAEATCSDNSLENGDPVQITKTGSGYKVLQISPDWQ